MDLVYASEKLKIQCTSVKAAKKPRKEQWRIILQPLDENENIYNPCNIDQIAGIVKIIEISEVSKHYE